MAMLLMVSATVWVFLNVAVFAVLNSFSTWFPNDNVAGVNVVCAYADPPTTRRKSKRAVPPPNTPFLYFAGLAEELWTAAFSC
jgi:hypothetical protein